MATKSKAAPRGMITILGVTRDGRGVGPRTIHRADVVATKEELERSGYTVILGMMAVDGAPEGSFHLTPDTNSAIVTAGERAAAVAKATAATLKAEAQAETARAEAGGRTA